MYRFLIVDDEYFVRQRVRLCIPWQEYGFEYAGEASNAEQAMELLNTMPIDLIILDISMPGVDGLELLRLMREKGNTAKFIILSGFATFDYAKQAIAYHVSGYLLKPIDTEELIRTVTAIKEELDLNCRQLQEQLAYEEARLLNHHAANNAFFQNIFSKQAFYTDSDQLKEYGIIPAEPYFLIMFDGIAQENSYFTVSEHATFQTALYNFSIGLLRKNTHYIHVTDAHKHQILIIPERDLKNGPADFLRSLQEIVKSRFSAKIIGSYGKADRGTADSIHEAYQTAVQFLTFRYIYGITEEPFPVSFPSRKAVDQISSLRQSICSSLKEKNTDGILNGLHHIFQIIQQEQFSLSSLEMALSSVLSSAVEYAIHHNLELFTEDQPCYTAAEVIYSGYSLEEIEEKFNQLFISLLNTHESSDIPMIQKLVLQAANLIEHEYSNPDMGLQYIASSLLISPAYLSRNFKQVMNCSVMQYITKCRMDYALELLSHTPLSISAVADQTGYKDSFYFSKCFKRYYGFSPSHVNR